MNVREQLISWGMVAAYVVLNSAGALAIKQVVHRANKPDFSSAGAVAGFFTTVLLSPLVLAGLAAIALSACAWILALSRMELSISYPVAVALNCLIVVTAGFALFGESLTGAKLMGIVMLFCSLVLLFRG